MNRVKEVFSAITNVRTEHDFQVGLKITMLSIPLSMILNTITDIMVGGMWEFVAVLIVVVVDTLFGTVYGIKNGGFSTSKAMMVVYKIVSYFIVLAALLLIEKGFPVLVWISEAVLIPIILFQVMSALKHMANLKLITNKQLSSILEKIDRHKNVSSNKEDEIISEHE